VLERFIHTELGSNCSIKCLFLNSTHSVYEGAVKQVEMKRLKTWQPIQSTT